MFSTGKGLMAQLEDAHKVEYKPLTMKSFKIVLFDMAIHDDLNKVDSLFENNRIDEVSKKRLKGMLRSSDLESTELARELINIKNKEHGN